MGGSGEFCCRTFATAGEKAIGQRRTPRSNRERASTRACLFVLRHCLTVSLLQCGAGMVSEPVAPVADRTPTADASAGVRGRRNAFLFDHLDRPSRPVSTGWKVAINQVSIAWYSVEVTVWVSVAEI